MKTIKQLAAELGCSKTAVMQKLEAADLKKQLHKQGNRFLVDEQTEKKLVQLFNSVKEVQPQTQNANGVNDKIIEMLQAELTTKNKQIEKLQEIIERQQADISNLTLAVQESHSLHAATMYQLQETADTEKQEAPTETASPRGLFSRIFRG